jgi:hypothetical protein
MPSSFCGPQPPCLPGPLASLLCSCSERAQRRRRGRAAGRHAPPGARAPCRHSASWTPPSSWPLLFKPLVPPWPDPPPHLLPFPLVLASPECLQPFLALHSCLLSSSVTGGPTTAPESHGEVAATPSHGEPAHTSFFLESTGASPLLLVLDYVGPSPDR